MQQLIDLLIITTVSITLSAQEEQQEKPKTPVEMAMEQADKLQELLKLNNKQLFLVVCRNFLLCLLCHPILIPGPMTHVRLYF